MRRVVWLLAVLALAGAQPSQAGRSDPRISVIDHQPFTVQGLGFRSGERLTVVLALGRRHVRVARADRRGSFVARFEEYASLCSAYNLRVLSGPNLRAAVNHRPVRSCAALDPVG